MTREDPRPHDRRTARCDRRRIVTAAPSPHRPQRLYRVGKNGRVEFASQDGWIPARGPQPVLLPEEAS